MILQIEDVKDENGKVVAAGFFDTHTQHTWVAPLDDNGKVIQEVEA